jgi:hypothetical protein
LIESTHDCPTFVTGYYCVGMSVTLINQEIGNFDSVVMCHPHIKDADLYQLCRFLFNYTKWTPENQSRIKKTKLYCYTQDIIDRCLAQEAFVERLCSDDFCGQTVSKQEATGKEPIAPSAREQKKRAAKLVVLENPKLWKKFTIHDEEDVEPVWKRAKEYYESFTGKELKGKSMPICMDGFYHTSISNTRGIRNIQEIDHIVDSHSWDSNLQLIYNKYKYARLYVGYENNTNPYSYTIYVKCVSMVVDENSTKYLTTYGKKKSI